MIDVSKIRVGDEVTAEYVRLALHYDPEVGVFTWKTVPLSHFPDRRSHSTWNANVSGTRAGWVSNKGYMMICVKGRAFCAHRLAWLYMTGAWPEHQIDHINLNRSDNRWSNLREATNSQNAVNTKAPSTNTSGVKGVSWVKRSKKWKAQINIDGVRTHLGLFDDKLGAAAAYANAASECHGEFARTA